MHCDVRWLALVPGLVIGGCAESGGSPRVEQWRLSDTPVTRIGVVEGDTAYQFHQVAGVVRLADGRIAVANGGNQELRFYDARGLHLATVSRSGDGPGEFRTLASIALLPGDSLLVLDTGTRRVSVLDADGGFVRSWAVAPVGRGMFPTRVLALEDGSVLILHARGRMPGDPGGVIRNSAPLVRYSPEGEQLGIVAEVPGEEWYYSDALRMLSYRPFGRKGHIAARGTQIYVGAADAYQIDMLDPDGQLLRAISQPGEPVAITADHIRLYTERQIPADAPQSARTQLERLYASMSFPETMPAYASLLADRDGNLWVEEYQFPEAGSARWSVLDAQGRLIATVETPGEFEPHFIGDGVVIGVTADELEVEYIEVYDLLES